MKKNCLIFLVLALLLSGCSQRVDNTHTPAAAIPQNQGAHYYSFSEAKEELAKSNVFVDAALSENSVDGSYSVHAQLKEMHYQLLSLGGTADFSVNYEASTGIWRGNYSVDYNYQWNIAGTWYGKVDGYYVTLKLDNTASNQLHFIVEAEYDAIGGGTGTYGQYDRYIDCSVYGNGAERIMYGTIDAGYPVFKFEINKDAILLSANVVSATEKVTMIRK